MRCVECGREIGENLKFCKYCGAPVKAASLDGVDDTIKCKACGASLKQGVVFCTQCGTPVNDEPKTSAKPGVSHEKDSTKRKSGKFGKIIIAALTIISVLLIGFLVYYFVGKSGILGRNTETTAVSTRDDSTESGSSSVETNMETEAESGTEAAEESISETDTVSDTDNVEDIAALILNERDNIVRGITSGSYSSMKVENDITAFTNSDVLVSISAGKDFRNDDYSRSFYYVDGKLMFAEYAGADLHQFFFENDKLIRWRYAQNVSNSGKAVNYDKENTTAYLQWEQSVLVDSNELINIWEGALQSDNNVGYISMSAVQNVTATSYLIEEQYGLSHEPSNVIDGTLSSAWVESAQGQGEGESVTLQFDGIYKLSGFSINAGYQKNEDVYYKNSRPCKMRITFSDGNSLDITLEDYYGQQNITFDDVIETSSVTFTILSVFPGDKYQDTVISEIKLY